MAVRADWRPRGDGRWVRVITRYWANCDRLAVRTQMVYTREVAVDMCLSEVRQSVPTMPPNVALRTTTRPRYCAGRGRLE